MFRPSVQAEQIEKGACLRKKDKGKASDMSRANSEPSDAQPLPPQSVRNVARLTPLKQYSIHTVVKYTLNYSINVNTKT